MLIFKNMFKRKYNVSFIDSKWQSIKRNLDLEIIPRIDELLFFDGEYFKVLNVIHQFITKKQEIFIVIEKLTADNQVVEK